jgi:ribonuclease T2
MTQAMIRATVLGLLFYSSVAQAAAPACTIPPNIAAPQGEAGLPEAIHRAPVTGYILALSWSPQFCRDRKDDPAQASQCGAGNQFGFILHGLWPEGEGRRAPAWCERARPLSVAQVRANFCMMPSARLQQHEWAKHGTCMVKDADRYFSAARLMYGAIRMPDMDGLSRRPLSVEHFAQTIVRANPGLPRSSILVQTTQGKWLKEVQICLAKTFRPQPCPRDRGRTRGRQALKIWRAIRYY